TVTDDHDCTVVSQVTLTNPSKIGNYVWNDLNQNGIQESGEPGLGGVGLHLIGATASGTQIHLVTTSDSTGAYAFDGLSAGSYRVKVDLPAIHVFTLQNVGNDLLDSDINPVDSFTQFITLPIGSYDSRWDVGLIVLDEKINIGDFVWQDADHDGIQDQFEQGISNKTVRLYAMPANTLLATTTTNAVGKYLFTDVMAGFYQVEFPLGNLPNGYLYSPQDQGTNDNIDSDPNPATGRTATFQVFPFTVDNLTIDAGIFKECDNVTDGGLIGYDEALCGIGANPAEIVGLAAPTGGFGVLEYLWLKSVVPVFNGPGDPNWSPIPNSNSPNYDPGPINQSTYYVRCSRRQGCPDYPGETNTVAKTVTASPLTQIIDQPGSLCVDEGGRFEAAIAGGGATYYWEFGPDATPSTATTRVVNAVSWSVPGIHDVSLTVTRFGCASTVHTTVEVTVCGNPLIIIFDDLIAEMAGEAVNLEWKVTSGDVSATIFFVQRSENGVDFENLAILSGNEVDGNGKYHFDDQKPRLGENIYRIKFKQSGQQEAEGYSGKASVFYQPKGVRQVQVYPNPTAGSVTVEFLKPATGFTEIQVWSAYGQVLSVEEVPVLSEKIGLDLSGYPLGVYWIRVKSENTPEYIVKIVKSE
ncbi:MAG: T9SS type A sorting domain-containing protein, partial [Bacteroidetes bacterium]|nr:T9SS type A sorting domain-containing protein [Bacteroidota bacterium]